MKSWSENLSGQQINQKGRKQTQRQQTVVATNLEKLKNNNKGRRKERGKKSSNQNQNGNWALTKGSG